MAAFKVQILVKCTGNDRELYKAAAKAVGENTSTWVRTTLRQAAQRQLLAYRKVGIDLAYPGAESAVTSPPDHVGAQETAEKTESPEADPASIPEQLNPELPPPNPVQSGIRSFEQRQIAVTVPGGEDDPPGHFEAGKWVLD